MPNDPLLLQKQKEENTVIINKSLVDQKNRLTDWKTDIKNQDDYRLASRERMYAINKEHMDGIKNLYGLTEAAPVSKDGPKQSLPVNKGWWLFRQSEGLKLKKAQKKYGRQISVNSIREQKAMEEYESIREEQLNSYDSYRRSGIDQNEIDQGLIPFLAMQKTSWFFWKKTVGALGNETDEEKRDAKAYNNRLMRQYTRSRAGSAERTALLDELRLKLMTFKITPDMLTDRYLADHSAQLRRFAEMTAAFKVLLEKNPGYMDSLQEEDRIMLNNTLDSTGPIIRDFLDNHQQCKHLGKRGRKTIFSGKADDDMSARNDELMKDTWNKILQADVKEQTAIGLKNKKIQSHLKRIEDEAVKRRNEEEKLPDYAILLKYDTEGKDEKRLLAMQEKIRNSTDTYEFFGNDMEKLFDQLSKTCITLDTTAARARALRDAESETREALKKDSTNRKYNAFIQYIRNELKNLDHDRSMLNIQADHYELALSFITGIKLTENDMQLPVMAEKDAEKVRKVLETENMTFLLRLDDCRFYAKEFTELTGGQYDFRSSVRDTISRARGQEVTLHTERIASLEKKQDSYKLTLDEILELKPEDLERYNFDGYTDEEGKRHKGAHDLTDEVNFRHMKEIESIAKLDIDKAREELKAGDTTGAAEAKILDLETKHSLFKDYYSKWEGTYRGIKTEAWKYLPQITDMEGQTGIFKDPDIFLNNKKKLQDRLDKVKADDPDSADIARLEDLITLMDAMIIRNGRIFDSDEEIKLMNSEAYKARYRQLLYTRRQNENLRSFLKVPSAAERNRLINRVDDVLYYEDRYAELKKTRGERLNGNLMKNELAEMLKTAKSDDEKQKISGKYYADQAVKMLELKEKLKPEFFTKENIRNNFDDFAETALALRDFARLIDSQETFERMMDALSEENKDKVSSSMDGLIKIADQMQVLLLSVFSANSVDFITGKRSSRTALIRLQMENMPDEKLAEEYRRSVAAVKERQDKIAKDKEEAERSGKKFTQTLTEVRENTELLFRGFTLVNEAEDFKSDLGEDYLDYNLTIQLQKLRDMDTFLGSDMKKDLFSISSPTEELYRYLYSDKASKDLSDPEDKKAWNSVLKKASEKPAFSFFSSLSEEARSVASSMMKDPGQIEDYLQWKARQDSRVYMNERSRMLGISESQEDTDTAYEIMDSIEETRSSVHNSASTKMRQTLFPELQKQGIDPEQFMHLLRIVHRTGGSMAHRMVDITNQEANKGRTENYLDPLGKTDFLQQVTAEVMSFEIKENMLSEEYLKEPGNFRYMYFMAQKLKAYEQLYKKDRKSLEEALKDNDKLLQRVNERFGTFYGNVSDHVYRMVMNFASKYGIDENGVRTFGLSAREYEQLAEEGNEKQFASISKENMENADREFRRNISDIKKRLARREAGTAAINSLRKHTADWLKPDAEEKAAAKKNIFQENQMMLTGRIVKGMENAMKVKNSDKTEQKSMQNVIELDGRLKLADVAYLLPEDHYKKIKDSKAWFKKDKELLSLNDLVSKDPAQQMNYLVENGHLESIVNVFRKHPEIRPTSKEDLYSEKYLGKNFSEELYTDARKMSVSTLLTNLIPNLFDESFINNAGFASDSSGNAAADALALQSSELRKSVEEMYMKDELSLPDYERSMDTVESLERQAELSRLKTGEQKKKIKALLKELKTYIGTEEQREFYKNYADNLNKYIQICGVNIDAPENAIGSHLSGMTDKKLEVLLGGMSFQFSESQVAVMKSMNQIPGSSSSR